MITRAQAINPWSYLNVVVNRRNSNRSFRQNLSNQKTLTEMDHGNGTAMSSTTLFKHRNNIGTLNLIPVHGTFQLRSCQIKSTLRKPWISPSSLSEIPAASSYCRFEEKWIAVENISLSFRCTDNWRMKIIFFNFNGKTIVN